MSCIIISMTTCCHLRHLKYNTVWLTQTVKPLVGNWAHNLISTVINQDTMWPVEIELLSNSILGESPFTHSATTQMVKQ